MKKILVLFASISCMALAAPKKVGYRESYGGDATISEFQGIARNLLISLSLAKLDTSLNVDPIKFENTINSVVISCKSNLEIDGIKKDAINYPYQSPQKLELDCDKWKALTNTYTNKVNLVAHEYLHLMGIDDSSYEYSFNLSRNYFSKQTIIKSRNDDLIAAAITCTIYDYNELLKIGVNIFYKNEYGITALDAAIMGGCSPIVKELYLLDFDKTNVTKLFQSLVLETAINSTKIAEYGYPPPERTKQFQLSMEAIKFLVSKNPDLAKLEYQHTFLSMGDPADYFALSLTNCKSGSTPLHFIASGVMVSYSYDVSPLLVNKQFYNDLITLGFSPDAMNHCGDRPNSLISNPAINLINNR